jgi:hypothetical protein
MRLGLAMLVASFPGCSIAGAQALPDSLIAQVRAGAARSMLRADSTVLLLVGSPLVPIVEVRLNGRGPYRFLIDLGSNVVVVRNSVAAAVRGTVLVDRVRGDIVRFDSLQLGDAIFEGVVAAGYDTLDVDGVLGYNLLGQHSFRLDYPAGRFVVHSRTLREPDDRTVLPYTVGNRLPLVTVFVGRDSLLVNLDTGASEWMTVPPGVRDSLPWAGPLEQGPTVSNNQTGSARVLRGRLGAPLRLGPLVLKDLMVYVNPDADGPWLGSAAMQNAAWTFDPLNRRLEIVPAGDR